MRQGLRLEFRQGFKGLGVVAAGNRFFAAVLDTEAVFDDQRLRLHVGAVFSRVVSPVTAEPAILPGKNISMVGEIIVKSNDSPRLTAMALGENTWRF